MRGNSWNAAPGEMSYDRDAQPIHEDGNEICAQCRRPFWMNHATDTGRLCNSCCLERDALLDVAAALKRMRHTEALIFAKK